MEYGETVELFVGLLICAFIGAVIGDLWRKSSGLGFLCGLLFGPLGWLLIGLSRDGREKCPTCGGVVKPHAVKCCHCGSWVTQSQQSAEPTRAEKKKAEEEVKIAKIKQKCDLLNRGPRIPIESLPQQDSNDHG